MAIKKEKTENRVGETARMEQKEKSRVQLFMEEMQRSPMVKIVDMRAVLK
jgi:hypothetical protein